MEVCAEKISLKKFAKSKISNTFALPNRKIGSGSRKDGQEREKDTGGRKLKLVKLGRDTTK
jgi:hypothetical protein